MKEKPTLSTLRGSLDECMATLYICTPCMRSTFLGEASLARLNPELMRGSLDLMVLSVLAAGPKYGYLVQNELREATGGLVDIQAGTLYPLLHRLELDKLVRCRWDESTGRKRRWYELTGRGRKKLAAQAHEWRQYAVCIHAVLSRVCEPHPRPA